MTPAELQAIRAWEQDATPGPWYVARAGWAGPGNLIASYVSTIQPGTPAETAEGAIWTERGLAADADAKFIAAARTVVPALLSEVERLTKGRDEYRLNPIGRRTIAMFNAQIEEATRGEPEAELAPVEAITPLVARLKQRCAELEAALLRVGKVLSDNSHSSDCEDDFCGDLNYEDRCTHAQIDEHVSGVLMSGTAALNALIAQAKREERERCAKVLDDAAEWAKREASDADDGYERADADLTRITYRAAAIRLRALPAGE